MDFTDRGSQLNRLTGHLTEQLLKVSPYLYLCVRSGIIVNHDNGFVMEDDNFFKFLNKILENVDSEIHGKILLMKKLSEKHCGNWSCHSGDGTTLAVFSMAMDVAERIPIFGLVMLILLLAGFVVIPDWQF